MDGMSSSLSKTKSITYVNPDTVQPMNQFASSLANEMKIITKASLRGIEPYSLLCDAFEKVYNIVLVLICELLFIILLE